MKIISIWLCLNVIWVLNSATAFYLPALSQVTYCKKGDTSENCKSQIQLYMNRLNSEKSIFPYDSNRFDFCTANDSRAPVKNLGQIIFGERVQPSPYRLEFLKDVTCATVCRKTYSGNDEGSVKNLEFLKDGIALDYQHNWIIDNLPVTWCFEMEDEKEYCTTGFPMGCFIDAQKSELDVCIINLAYNKPHAYYLFNHVDLIVTYHSGAKEEWGSLFGENGGVIISVKVVPRSIKHGISPDCGSKVPLEISDDVLSPDQELEITYTYSVKFVENNNIQWSSRWDHIFGSAAHINIQWFSTLNSLIIVQFLSGMVAIIMLRLLPRDIALLNQKESEEDVQKESVGDVQKKAEEGIEKEPGDDVQKESVGDVPKEAGEDIQKEPGWHLIRGDVFRAPRNAMLLSVLLASGVQVFCTTLASLALASFGFFPAVNRGALVTFAVALYLSLGTVAGYMSARIYKGFGGGNWISNALFTSMLNPGIIFSLYFIMNMIFWAHGSSAAVPFGCLITLVALWFGVSMPLTLIGAYFGFKRKPLEHSITTNEMPRQIPVQKFCRRPIPSIVVGGVLSYSCIFIQQYFILNSLWSSQMYDIFGSLFLAFFMLVITCAELTIVSCYFHLSAEDYHWKWRSFLTSGSTAFYFFAYCVHYFITKLDIEDTTSMFLYFACSWIMAYLLFLLTGSVGFFACFYFVRKIYSIETDCRSPPSTNYDKLDPKGLRADPSTGLHLSFPGLRQGASRIKRIVHVIREAFQRKKSANVDVFVCEEEARMWTPQSQEAKHDF